MKARGRAEANIVLLQAMPCKAAKNPLKHFLGIKVEDTISATQAGTRLPRRQAHEFSQRR